MANTYSQGAKADASAGQTLAFSSNVTPGDMIVVAASVFNPGGGSTPVPVTLSDNQSGVNTYALVASVNSGDTLMNLYACYSVANSGHTASPFSLSLTVGGTGITYNTLVIAAFNGFAVTPTLDGTIHGTLTPPAGTTAAPATSSFTPGAGDLVLAIYGDDSGAETAAAGSGWTTQTAINDTSGASDNTVLEYQLSAAGTAITGTWAITSYSGVDRAVLWAAFKTTAGGSSTPVTASETGTGSDSGTIRVYGTDSSAGSDLLSLVATITILDTGTGAETLLIAVPLAEASTASDTLLLSASLPTADSGAGADASTLTAAATSTDAGVGTETGAISLTSSAAGTGTDSPLLTASASSGESGTGTDTSSLRLAATENGTGGDTPTLAATTTTGESGAGTDTASSNGNAAVTAAEAGSASDSGLLTATSTTADGGGATDTATTGAPISASDSGSGADSASGSATVTGAESGSSADALPALGVGLTFGDLAGGADSHTGAMTALFPESGTGVDTGSTGVPLTTAEAGTGSDAAAIPQQAYTLTESGTASETLAVAVMLALAEIAAALEHLSASGQALIIRAAFRALSRVLAFRATPRTLAFAAPIRGTHFIVPGTIGQGGQTVQLQPAQATVYPSYIGALESNIIFTADLSSLVGAAAISSVSATATVVSAYGGVVAPGAIPADVTATFVRSATATGSVVTVTCGNGAQTLNSLYTVTLVVTLNNSPASTPEALFQLQCTA